jgi:hypothetical protein
LRYCEKTAEARLVTAICKGAAVKGGQILSLEEMRDLVKRLSKPPSRAPARTAVRR